MRRTHLGGDRGLDGLGRRLAADLERRGLADAVLLCRKSRAAIAGIAARDHLVQRKRGRPVVVHELRGFEDVEYLVERGRGEADLTSPEKDELARRRFREELACRRADGVLAVSRPMERFVLKRYALDRRRVGRVPGHAAAVEDAERLRAAARADLRIGDRDLVLAWCAKLAPWELPETAIRIFEGVRAVRRDAWLVLVTDRPAEVEKLLAERDAQRVVVRRGEGDVRKILCAADYGLLVRGDHIVNRTACPIVFGEYLACGVRPAISPHLGDQSELCEVTGLGVVVGLASTDLAGRAIAQDAARAGVLDEAGRERRRAWARETISPARAAIRVAEFLDGIGVLSEAGSETAPA